MRAIYGEQSAYAEFATSITFGDPEHPFGRHTQVEPDDDEGSFPC
jgi:hypothetical protein